MSKFLRELFIAAMMLMTIAVLSAGAIESPPRASSSYAVIDRIVDETFAVILAAPGSDETIVHLSFLADERSEKQLVEGMWGTFETEWDDGRLVAAQFVPDPSMTEETLRRIETKVAILRSR